MVRILSTQLNMSHKALVCAKLLILKNL